MLHPDDHLVVLIFQEMKNVFVHPVVKILHYLQPAAGIHLMQGDLLDPFCIGPDQATVPDPPPVITPDRILPVPGEVHIKGLVPVMFFQSS